MEVLGAVAAGAAASTLAGVVGDRVNAAFQTAVDPDNKKGVDWDAIIAPVPQEMRARYPGLELLCLEDQSTLVLHQKVEPAEVLADVASWFVVTGFDVETSNTYAIRSRDEGTTYYIIKEDGSLQKSCGRNCCRSCMQLRFLVTNVRTGEEIGAIDSPKACDDSCCGMYCTYCCCTPVCCCLRTATWTERPSGRVLARIRKVPLCNPCCCCCCPNGDALNTRLDLTFPLSDGLPPLHLYRDDCEFVRDPKRCWHCLCDTAETIVVDHRAIHLPPGNETVNHMSHPTNVLGRVWTRVWRDKYEPSEGHPQIQGRYLPLPKRKPGLFTTLKDVALSFFTDADTYLHEMPSDDPQVKAGLLAAAIMMDMVIRERDDSA